MGFLKKLFGGGDGPKKIQDKQGIFVYVRSQRCAEGVVRCRIDKQYDLNREGSGYVWHKTIVDSKCFSQMKSVIHFDQNYQIVSADIQGGDLITAEEYEAQLAANQRPSPTDEENDTPA